MSLLYLHLNILFSSSIFYFIPFQILEFPFLFFLRIAGLVLGWFLLLFFFELFLRLFLNIIALILTSFRGKVVDCVEDGNDEKLVEENTSLLQNTKKDL